MEAHIIPQVFMRGFRVDIKDGDKDTVRKAKATVNIFKVKEDSYKENVLIKETSTITDFYGDEIEKFLQHKFETPFGNLKLKLNDFKNPRYTRIKKEDFILLVTFAANMWRRSDTHLNKSETINVSEESMKQYLYSEKTLDLDTNSDIILKTLHCYDTYIVFNESDITFPVHNKHATIRSFGSIPYYPKYVFEPINNRIMVIHKLKPNFKNHIIKIEKKQEPSILDKDVIKVQSRIVTDNDVITNIIETYCMVESPVDYYICDNTNIDTLRRLYKNAYISRSAQTLFENTTSKLFIR